MPITQARFMQVLKDGGLGFSRVGFGHQLGANQLKRQGDGGDQHEDGDGGGGMAEVRRAQHAGDADVVAEVRQADEDRADQQDEAAAQDLGVARRASASQRDSTLSASGSQAGHSTRSCLDLRSCGQLGALIRHRSTNARACTVTTAVHPDEGQNACIALGRKLLKLFTAAVEFS